MDIEVERRGGEQARRRAGSLKPLHDPSIRAQLSKPPLPLLIVCTSLSSVQSTDLPLSRRLGAIFHPLAPSLTISAT